MACVILIHAKNKNERMEILNSFSDNFNFEVIMDLKKYVEDKYRGRFVEDEEVGGGDSTQIEAVESVENKNIPLLTAMVQNDQLPGLGGNKSTNLNTVVPEEDGYGTFIPYRDRMVEPKEEDVAIEATAGIDIPVISLIEPDQTIANTDEGVVVGEQPVNECDINPPESVPQLDDIAHNDIDVADHTDIPFITHSYSDDGNIQNNLHTDDVRTTVPYLENVVSDVLLANNTTNSETQVAVRRSTRSMKRGRNVVEDGDGEEDTQKENTKSPSLYDRPSTSAARRSGRITKRPAYLMDDEDGVDDCPVSTKAKSESKKREQKGEDERVKTGIECMKCMKQLNAQYRRYSRAKDHAVIHTDLVRYECPVDGCGYKCGTLQHFDNHKRKKHDRNLSAKNIKLTTEQEKELDKITKECFPGFGTEDKYKVCAVCETAIVNNNLNQYHLKRHSLQHVDFMLYKCNQSKCEYACKFYKHLVEHGRKTHKIEELSKEATEVELTDDQKKKIDDMMKKCFSETNINNTVATGIECKKCLKQLSAGYRRYHDAKTHAITHTDLVRYECVVDECGYKSGLRQSVREHARTKHSNSLLPTRNIDLTNEQEEELDRMTKECFPVFETEDEYKVCTICQTAISNNGRYLKRHSLQHIDFMLYKCNQRNCHYEAKYYNNMTIHLRNKHGIEEMSKEDTAIELTDDQKKKIDDMLKKCFPNEEDVEE